MRTQSYEYLLLYHCAPTLYGVKSANLFTIRNVDADGLSNLVRGYSDMLRPFGLGISILRYCRNNALFYVYNKERLTSRLSIPAVRKFMGRYGYTDCSDAHKVISHLITRISENGEFPHEIGILLDYPLGDVIGFIKNRGSDCLCCGCWKVYQNKNQALKLFECFEECRCDACQKYNNGLSVRDILSNQRINVPQPVNTKN